MCMHMHVFTYVRSTRTWIRVHVGDRGDLRCHLRSHLGCFLRQRLSLAWSSLYSLGQLANGPGIHPQPLPPQLWDNKGTPLLGFLSLGSGLEHGSSSLQGQFLPEPSITQPFFILFSKFLCMYILYDDHTPPHIPLHVLFGFAPPVSPFCPHTVSLFLSGCIQKHDFISSYKV